MLIEPKLMIMGYAEHGKDTICKLLEIIFGWTSIQSSFFANEHVVYPILKDRYCYSNSLECYNDRRNKRQEWYELIKAYNTPDGCRLARDLYSQFNIYNGVRNIEEYEAIKNAKLFDYSIWVDASDRLPIESEESCTVKPRDADIVFNNNDPLYISTGNLINLIISLYPNITSNCS